MHFLVWSWASSGIRSLSFQSWQTSVLSWVFSVLEMGKSRRIPNPMNTVMEHNYGVSFGQKITGKQRCVSRCIIAMQKPWIIFPQIRVFSSYLLHANDTRLQSNIPHWPYDLLTKTHNALRHYNRRKLWTNPSHLIELGVLFRSWFLWPLLLGLLGFSFEVITIYPRFVINYNDLRKSGSSLTSFNSSWTMPTRRYFWSELGRKSPIPLKHN